VSARSDFLSSLIGVPWCWESGNCWDFAVHVERQLFGRSLPKVWVPTELSKRWVLEAIEAHPERGLWDEVEPGGYGVVTAPDGALVLMAHLRMPAHIGVWLKPEQRVIHCSEQHGVCFEPVLALRQMGWRNMKFYQPKAET
jgi:hypothetical protein